MKRLGSAEAGSTIIDALVALAILAAALAAFIPYGKSIMDKRTSADLIRQRTLIKTMLLSAVSCEKIGACAGNETRALIDRDDRVLVLADGTSTYGPWQVRAQCRDDQTIDVRVASIQNGEFRKDPVNGRILNWDNPESVIIRAGVLCGKLTEAKIDNEIVPLRGKICLHTKGTCAPPKQSVGVGGPARMCCETGSDMPKPVCPTGKTEIGAYWDREGDWGADGSWVVLCQ